MRRSLLGSLLLAPLVLTGCDNGDANGGGHDLTPPPVGDMATAPDLTPAPDLAQPPTGTPKRVIFFLGDGMGIVPLTAARIYAVGEGKDITIDTLPETGFVRTYSNDALVTDSAPSMSAYMTGVKMNNEVLSMTSETVARMDCPASNGAAVPTFLETVKAQGWGTGVVTTTRITHATPAATYAHICHRDLEFDIAAQLTPGGAGYNKALGDGVDVVFGGGQRFFQPKGAGAGQRTDGRDLLAELGKKGYQAGTTRAFFDGLDGKAQKAIGLFTADHLSYEADRDATKEPSLAEMTTKAMTLLEKRGSYFLMVEGGRIDHALHGTNAARALVDTVAFDNAIKAAIDRAKQSDPTLANTLIVVTADHDHTMVMNGYSKLTGPTTASSAGILGVVKNVDTGLPDNDDDGVPYTILVFGNGESRVDGARSTVAALTDVITSAVGYHQEAAVPMPAGSETHGGTDVFIGAIGMKASEVHGFMDNIAVYSILRHAAGF